MNRLTSLAALLLVTACAATVPDSNPTGPGFGNPSDFQAQRAARDAELSGDPLITGLEVSDEVVADAPTTIQTAGPINADNPAISDEQNFDAVSARESIESDAERLAQARAQRQEVRVEALPRRPANTGPNIVEFALATTNNVGQPVYQRGLTSASRTERNCGKYRSPDAAQQAFLASGGPQRDREGLDPDGDGFACAWNPAPYRAARRSTASSIASDAVTAIGQ